MGKPAASGNAADHEIYNFVMRFRRSTRRFTAWFSMLVLVLNAWMPLAAQAMAAAAEHPDWQQICTSTGMVQAKSQAAAPSGKPDPGSSLDPGCPFCPLHAGVAGLPPSDVNLSEHLTPAEMPTAFYQAADTSSVWLTARSRAPPFLA